MKKSPRVSTRLTAHVKAGGCACKLSPKILDRALSGLPRASHPQDLVGFETSGDVGVYTFGPIPRGAHSGPDFAEGKSAQDDLLYYPLTSGGLLVSLPAADASLFMEYCASGHLAGAWTSGARNPS